MSQSHGEEERPHPVITEATAAFWEGARSGRLVLQRCRACGNFDHPPYPECTRCRSSEIGYEEVSGNGAIYERAIVRAPVVRGFESEIPYAVIVVELDEQPGLLVLSNLVGSPPEEAMIGRHVEASFEPLDSETSLVMFRLAAIEGR